MAIDTTKQVGGYQVTPVSVLSRSSNTKTPVGSISASSTEVNSGEQFQTALQSAQKRINDEIKKRNLGNVNALSSDLTANILSSQEERHQAAKINAKHGTDAYEKVVEAVNDYKYPVEQVFKFFT